MAAGGPTLADEAKKSAAYTSQIIFETAQTKIGYGEPTSNYPAVGLLLNNGAPMCTGTLVSPLHFLTAQHCVRGKSWAKLTVFFQHGGFYGVAGEKGIFTPPETFRVENACGSQNDIAIIQLNRPAHGIAPVGVNTSTPSLLGSSGVIVGFGFDKPKTRLGEDSGDMGIKREGKVDIGPCTFAASCFMPTTDLVCWSIPAGTTLHNTCPGDSGGPLLVQPERDNLVSGVTSSGVEILCASTGKADMSFDTQTYHHRQWIASILATAPTEPSPLDPLPEMITNRGDRPRYSWNFAHFKHGEPVLNGRFSVKQAKILRVGLNHAANAPEGFSRDANLRLSLIPPDGAPKIACKSQPYVSFCEVENPAEGEWRAELVPLVGEGDFQLTVSVF